MTTKAENFIHIRFENPSAVECKRDILATEIDLIKMNKRLQKYIDSRIQELEIKEDMDKKLRALKLDLGRLQNLMPGVKIPQLLKESHAEKIEEKPLEAITPVKKMSETRMRIKETQTPTDKLDAELQSIQEKLNALA